MKIDPQFKSLDICHTSISLLKEKATKYLEQQFAISSIWIPDEDTRYVDSTPTQDVLLMGGFLQRFLETGNWPDTAYRFWVCSNSTKSVMTKLLSFMDDEISVLPRYNLFAKGLEKNFQKEKINLVYAGRLSPSKNIECLLRTVCYLQNKYNLPVELHIFGDFDNFTSPDRGRWEPFSYQEHIELVCATLKWKAKPHFYGRQKPLEWINTPIENPVYINFSTFIFEDFNVALAQTQEHGWPYILSHWGGFQDQTLTNGVFIPWKMIARTDESKALIDLKSEVLADYLYSSLTQLKTTNLSDTPTDTASCVLPKAITHVRLDKLRRKFLTSLGAESYLLTKENLANFADTPSGKKFFSQYRLLFGGNDPENAIRIVINDFNSSNDPINQHIIKTSRAISLNISHPQTVVFVPTRELSWPENFLSLAHDREIHFSFNHPNLNHLIDFTKATVSKNCSVTIHDYKI